MKFNYDWIKNPAYFAVNRLPAHSNHKYYRSEEDVVSECQKDIYSLNGSWKFKYANNLSETIKGFEAEEFSCKNWGDIKVPGHMETQGFLAPQYVNTMYPWDGHEKLVPGEIPTEFNPVGSYVKYFQVPATMQGKKLYISFQGVESAFALWLNGKFIGYSEDTFTPSEFDLTNAVIEGENKLAVQVFKWSGGSWLEDQDFWRLSGIFRDVYLYTKPELHIEDLFVKTKLDAAYQNAMLEIQIKTSGEIKGTVEAYLYDIPDYGTHTLFTGRAKEKTELLGKNGKNPSVEIKKAGQLLIQETVTAPKLWSAENPALYLLTLLVKNQAGDILEVVTQRIGFRQFELKNGLMLINGKRVVFKGTNRHEFNCYHGRAVSIEDMMADVKTMKKNNINAIRTSHYPNSPAFYDLCDEYGFYVIDETNLETHGTWGRPGGADENTLPKDRTDWCNIVIDRTDSLFNRDKNHACVIIWSCGNESYGGLNIYKMSENFRRLDDTRLVHYEGIKNDRSYNATSDMESQMYTSAIGIAKFIKENPEKPFICCEYTHSMGNSNGAMHKYTDLTDTELRYQGGFIWDYIDQAIVKKDRYGKDFYAYGGDFDDKPCDYNFCGNGIVFANRESTSKMQEVKFNYQNITIVVEKTSAVIKNKANFLATDIYEGRVAVKRDGKLIEQEVFTVSVAPLSEKKMTLPIQKKTIPGEYTITVSFCLKEDMAFAQAGHEVAFGQFVYKIAKKKTECSLPVKTAVCDANIGVKGENFHAIFGKEGRYCGLVSYKFMGRELLSTIPAPNFWRAPTDNDIGNQMMARCAQWKIASLYYKLKSVDCTHKPNQAKITYIYTLPSTPAAEVTMTYTVFGDGRIKTELDYEGCEGLSELPEFGVLFKMPADYDCLTWYGNGPEETYCDREKGAKLGLYHNHVADNMEPYLMPQECGNKTEVRYAQVTDEKGFGLRFEAEKPMNFSALTFTPHELETAMHPYELPPVHYTVIRTSLMQMGIGGDDSWGARTHEEYCIKNMPYHFEFVFGGIL